ncbi:MAG: hypothetical protein ACFBZ9_14190 [Sphingomonadales bacterium]
MAISLSQAARQAAANAVVDLIDAGSGPGRVVIYAGTPPANADAALSGNTILASLPTSDPAFGNADASGTATAGSITQQNASDTGDATFFRVEDSDSNVVKQGTVTQTGSGGDMQLANVTITSGNPVEITSYTHQQPAGG